MLLADLCFSSSHHRTLEQAFPNGMVRMKGHLMDNPHLQNCPRLLCFSTGFFLYLQALLRGRAVVPFCFRFSFIFIALPFFSTCPVVSVTLLEKEIIDLAGRNFRNIISHVGRVAVHKIEFLIRKPLKCICIFCLFLFAFLVRGSSSFLSFDIVCFA